VRGVSRGAEGKDPHFSSAAYPERRAVLRLGKHLFYANSGHEDNPSVAVGAQGSAPDAEGVAPFQQWNIRDRSISFKTAKTSRLQDFKTDSVGSPWAHPTFVSPHPFWEQGVGHVELCSSRRVGRNFATVGCTRSPFPSHVRIPSLPTVHESDGAALQAWIHTCPWIHHFEVSSYPLGKIRLVERSPILGSAPRPRISQKFMVVRLGMTGSHDKKI
jgi:hypothetical protein